MSESMAFIGGVAVAGLAALLLLKGTNIQQPNFPITPPMQQPIVATQPMFQPPPPPYPGAYGNPTAPISPNTEERVATERLKYENEGLKKENEQIKNQNQQLVTQLQQLGYQQQIQQQLGAQNRVALNQSENHWWSSPIVWAVAGMTLTVGGGIVVAGVLSLFSQKDRTSRTVQVIHPYHGPTPPLAPIRRAEFLPSRNEARRVQATEYDDMQ